MDFRAVLIFLCLLVAQATCKTITNGANKGPLNSTVDLMQKKIRTVLHHLLAPELLPNVSCPSLHVTGHGAEVVGQQPPAHPLCPFLCYTSKMSNLILELSEPLLKISQYIQDETGGGAARQDCSLPTFDQDMDKYVFLKCLLQDLDQQLSKAE